MGLKIRKGKGAHSDAERDRVYFFRALGALDVPTESSDDLVIFASVF